MKNGRVSSTLKRLIPMSALFFGITLCYFLPMLSSRNIFVERDLAAFFIPPRYLWVSLVKSFQVPLWNPFNYSGIPLLATLQPGVFYPPHLLYFLLPFNIAWNWIIILHFFLATVTTYSLLRHLRASSGGATLGAITFMLSGYLISVHNLLTHLLAVAWFPLIIVCFLRYFEKGSMKFLVFTSIFLTVQFFAGAPEISIMTIMVLCVIATFAHYFVDTSPEYVLSPATRIKALGLTLSLVFLLSSIQLLPFLELEAHSIRITGLSYPEAITWSFAWKDFIQFFIPDAFGYFSSTKKYWSNQSWLLTLYWGITPFVLSLFYFISTDKKRVVFGSLIVISLVLALGGNTPVYKLLYHIPPFNSIRYPVKFIFLFIFLVAVTAGLGFDTIKKGIQEDNPRVKRTIAIFFYSGFIFVVLWGYMSIFGDAVSRFFDSMGFVPDVYNETEINIHNIKRFLLFSFLFCILLLVYMRVRFKKTAAFLIILIVALDMFLANTGYYTSGSWKFYIDSNELGEHTFFGKISDNKGPDRYFVTFKTLSKFNHFPYDRAILSPPYAPLFGLYSFSGAEVLRIGYYETFSSLLKDSPNIELGKRFLDVSGIRYVVTASEWADRDFTLLQNIEAGTKTAHLYEYMPYPGRFLLYGRIHTASDDKEIIAKLLDQSIDLRKELIIFSKDVPNLSKHEVRGNVKLISYRANSVSLTCSSEHDAFLYVSDTYYPGWKAYIDGKEVSIYRANLAFRAVYLPKGFHTVLFVYRPFSFYIGCCLTTLGLLASFFLLIKSCRREIKHGQS
jgi:hypothetical protein